MITPMIWLNLTVLVGEFFPVLNILTWGELSRVGSGAMITTTIRLNSTELSRDPVSFRAISWFTLLNTIFSVHDVNTNDVTYDYVKMADEYGKRN